MSQAYRTQRPRASRILTQVFDLKDATALGGLNHLARFVNGLRLDRKLAVRFRTSKSSWSTWSLDRVLRVLIDASFAGIERLFHFEDLETEPLLCAQHGVDRLPDLKTLYRDLRRFEDRNLLRSLHDIGEEVVVEALAKQDRVVLEFDSTVETLYGRQEGAEIGTNPRKPGRPSYHPLLARDRISDLVVHHQLRPGDTGTATDAASFVHKTIDIVKKDGRSRTILSRMDSGFETDGVLSAHERRGVGYVAKMRVTPQLGATISLLGPHSWTPVATENESEIQVASFEWTRSTWKAPRRVVVLRKREQERIQGRLFDHIGWSYAVFVTNLDWDAAEIARFYDKRADVERTICEAKYDLSIDHVPTASFGANAADLALKLLARNLLVLYRDRGLGLKTRVRVMTLRRRYLMVAGRIVRHGGQRLLRLAKHSALQIILNPHPVRT